MARYYNRRRSPAPTFSPGDMVYLDSEDIQTTRPSKKHSHHCLGPYLVERRVRRYAYRLVLPPPMRRRHPVFNVMKLSPAPDDPIVGRHWNPPPPPELVDGDSTFLCPTDTKWFRSVPLGTDRIPSRHLISARNPSGSERF